MTSPVVTRAGAAAGSIQKPTYDKKAMIEEAAFVYETALHEEAAEVGWDL